MKSYRVELESILNDESVMETVADKRIQMFHCTKRCSNSPSKMSSLEVIYRENKCSWLSQTLQGVNNELPVGLGQKII